MEAPRLAPPLRRLLLLGVAAALLLQLTWRAEDSLTAESPVWDETMHLDYGLNFLRLGPAVPPRDHPYPETALLALPLALTEPAPDQVVARPALPDGRTGELRRVEDPRNLWPARRMNVALAVLGLAALAALAGRRLGSAAGLWVLALGALDPGWIAAARYVTTDTGQAVALGLGMFAVLRDCEAERPRWGALVLAGLAMAAALCAKLSGALLVPMAVVAHLAVARAPSLDARAARPWRTRALRGAVAGAGVAAVGLGAWVGVFELAALIHGHLGDGFAHLRAGLEAFAEVRSMDRGTWLFGHFFAGGTVLYFPALLLAKTPVALLFALGAAALPRARELLRPVRPVLAAAALFLVIAVASGVNLGLRHLTPVLPALWIAGAAGLVALGERVRLAPAALAAALALEVLAAHPDYLAFTNAAFGGVDGAHEVAVDSASDWGQSLPALAAWARENAHGEPLHLAYFGTADPVAYGLQSVWRPCPPLGRPRPGKRAPAAPCEAPAGLLAISSTCVAGAGGAAQDPCWERLRGREPEAALGGSILVFRGVEAAR